MPIFRPAVSRSRQRGFTLLELMVVIAIMALATMTITLSFGQNGQRQLEREALRLSALLEGARAQSRADGAAIDWRLNDQGFEFDRTDGTTTTSAWLTPEPQASSADPVLLGPEPLIGPQSIVIYRQEHPQTALRVSTDGLLPFQVQSASQEGAP